MIGKLAVRSLTAHPVRSAVLAAGFGVGVAVMAILLGVADIVLQQAQSPALVGGGDVVIRIAPQVSARLVLSGALQADTVRHRIRVASPSHRSELYLVGADGTTTQVAARAGIPSLEQAIGDEETSGVLAWRDAPADVAWTQDTPDKVLRHIDRFHPIPDVPEWAGSWAEWLYFNGRSAEVPVGGNVGEGGRFYLTFLVGPRLGDGRRGATMRLQVEHGGRVRTYSTGARLSDEDVQRAPDLTIGRSFVRLAGMQYHLHVDAPDERGGRAIGDLTLEASAGRLVPPFEVSGARGWRTGYVVPVMAGRLRGTLTVDGEEISFDEGTGYHDHNWGFWERVSWQWGQVQHGDLSFLYGRVFPPPEAADAERIPGVVGAIGPDGPLGYATDVRISEVNDANGRPQSIEIHGRGASLDLSVRFDVASAITTRMTQGPLATGIDFIQMRGTYHVTGHAGDRVLDFTAPGAAETFRGRAR